MSDTTAAVAAPGDDERAARKERQGVVVSAKQDKTIVVAIQRRTTTGVYAKTVNRSKHYHVHDEDNSAGQGDTVRIVETRPLSKLKRWRLVEVVEKAK